MIGKGILFLYFAVTLGRFLFSAHFDLTPDESYYWYWSEHFQLSYFDHPPLVAWMIRISTFLIGKNEFAVRLPSLLLGIGDTYFIYRLAELAFKSREAGISAALLLNSLLIFSVGNVLMTPDSPLIFFWILTLYFVYHAAIGKKDLAWLPAGLGLGFGLLSKYTMILFVPSLFLFLIFNKPCRACLIRWQPWAALLIAGLVFSPVLIWNYQNHWISFLFQIHHGTDSGTRSGIRTFFEFLGSQAGILSPLVWIGLLASLFKAFRIGRNPGLPQFAYLFWMTMPVFFFCAESFRTKIEANWPVFGYAGAIILLGGFLNQLWRNGKYSPAPRWTAGILLVVSFLFTLLVHLQAFYKIAPLKVEVDRTYDLTGWKNLKLVYDRFPDKSSWPLLATHHTVVTEAAFYLGKEDVFQTNAPYRITSLSEERARRIPKGTSFLLLTVDDDRLSDRDRAMFARITPLAAIPVFYETRNDSRLIRTFYYSIGEDFQGISAPGNRERAS